MVKYRLYKILHFLHLISKDKYRKLKAKYTADYLLILKSKYFDKEWYLRTNPDVEEAGIDPIKHYLEHGWKERRNPSILFDGNKYLKEFPDVRNSKVNPLLHYEKYGKKENRNIENIGIKQLPLIERIYMFLLRKAANCSLINRDCIIMNDLIFDYRAEPLDNFAFFEYAVKQKKGLKSYYILNKKSANYAAIKKKYGQFIISYRNKNDIWFRLRLLILTFKTRYMLDSFDAMSKVFYDVFYSSPYITTIFTQHGITFFKQDYIKSDVYGQKKLNKTTVSNDLEYEIFKNKGKFKSENIIKLGLFRWDKIQDNSYRQNKISVFVYFTYRHYLHGIKNMVNTNYFKKILSLLKNQELAQLFKQNNVEFKIALHHDLLVNPKKMKGIKFVSEDDIIKVKNEARMLITDYSSMCFEFMFQEKPVIFYRFDKKEFNDSLADCQYSKNLKDLDKYIYNLVSKEEQVIRIIKRYINNNFRLEKKNSQKARVFFYNKKDIRKRFYQYLLKHKGEIKK